ncbi:MAG: outer membrane lipoprotein LolB [Sodalis sp. Ffu]|nr:MAG: outer membrane lipoprotein LolB [Sodalis sp. Ffu]
MPMCKNICCIRLLPIASLFLAACVHTPYSLDEIQISPQWHSNWESVWQLSRYQALGTFLYISSKQKVYARFNWQQINTKHYRLLFTNPLGYTEIDLTVQPGRAQLINHQGKRYVSDDPEMMIAKLTKMDIPLNDLRQWMLGLPGAATDFILDSRGYLKTLNYQHNGKSWTVNYQRYSDETIPPLPSNLELRHGENCIKLKIDSWIL